MGNINSACLPSSDVSVDVLIELIKNISFVRSIADIMKAKDFAPAPSEEPSVPRSQRTRVFLGEVQKAIWTEFCNSGEFLQDAQQEIHISDGNVSFSNQSQWDNAETRELYRKILKMSIMELEVEFSGSVGFLIGRDYEVVLIFAYGRELSLGDYMRLSAEKQCFLF